MVRYSRDREKFHELLEENREVYSRLDSDTREMIEVVGRIRIGEEYEVMESGEKKYNMCKAFLDMKLEGIEEGKIEGRAEEIIESGREFGFSEEEILKRLRNKLKVSEKEAQEFFGRFREPVV